MSLVLDEPPTERTRYGQPVRAGAAVVVASAAGGCLVEGLSYPGFPVELAAMALLAAVSALVLAASWGVRARRLGRGGRAATVLVAVVVLLGAGVVAADRADLVPLRARWAASQVAFEAEAASAGPPVPLSGSDESGSTPRYPGGCPAMIGKLRISECRSIDRGYLYLQAQGALTDDSGIAYLPQGPQSSSDGFGDEALIPLGGPWWSWTCYC